MTALADALADVTTWLPRAAALTAHPDTTPASPGGKPGSRPPWNQAASNALWDALAVIAETRAMFAWLVHGRLVPAYPYAATGAALDAIGRLGHAVPPDRVRQAVRELHSAVQAVMMLPAVDEAERPQKVTAACPYCGASMLRVFPRSGQVTCLRFGACFDADGRHPAGTMEVGRLGAQVVWNDGLVAP